VTAERPRLLLTAKSVTAHGCCPRLVSDVLSCSNSSRCSQQSAENAPARFASLSSRHTEGLPQYRQMQTPASASQAAGQAGEPALEPQLSVTCDQSFEQVFGSAARLSAAGQNEGVTQSESAAQARLASTNPLSAAFASSQLFEHPVARTTRIRNRHM